MMLPDLLKKESQVGRLQLQLQQAQQRQKEHERQQQQQETDRSADDALAAARSTPQAPSPDTCKEKAASSQAGSCNEG